MDLPTVLDYLGQASAAGVIGTSSYAAVTRLAAWAGRHLGWRREEPDTVATTDISEEQFGELKSLFEAAKAEWSPREGRGQNQNIHIRGGNKGPIINMPQGHIGHIGQP